MKYLNLSNMPATGDFQYSKFIQKCNFVERLNLCNSPSISDSTIFTIFKNLEELKMLNLNMCSQFDQKYIDEIRNSFPHVNILRNSRNQSDARDDGLRVWLPKRGAKKPDDKKKKKK